MDDVYHDTLDHIISPRQMKVCRGMENSSAALEADDMHLRADRSDEWTTDAASSPGRAAPKPRYSHLLEAGADIRTVRELLRHCDASTKRCSTPTF